MLAMVLSYWGNLSVYQSCPQNREARSGVTLVNEPTEPSDCQPASE